MRARIKKSVKPYGGRIVLVDRVHTYPNGRRVVEVYPPTDGRYRDVRTYNIDEVEILDDALASDRVRSMARQALRDPTGPSLGELREEILGMDPRLREDD